MKQLPEYICSMISRIISVRPLSIWVTWNANIRHCSVAHRLLRPVSCFPQPHAHIFSPMGGNIVSENMVLYRL